MFYAFRKMDINQDGFVSHDEFWFKYRQVETLLGIHHHFDEIIEHDFNDFDPNGDGQVDFLQSWTK